MMPQPRALTDKHPFRQWLYWEMPHCDWSIEGYSRASDKTFFFIPQIPLCLDAGLAEGRRGDYVLLSHTHDDHIADIEYLSARDGVQIYLPQESRIYLDDYIYARRRLNHSAPYHPALMGKHQLHGLLPQQRFEIQEQYEVKTVACQHSIPSLGYALSQRRKRLLPEWEALKQEMQQKNQMEAFGERMAEERQKGPIEEWYWEPLLVFMGDTTSAVFEENNWLFDYPLIFTECTFLAEADYDRAQEKQHSHWRDLKPFIQAHPEVHFMLTHFSLRYSDAAVLDFLKQQQLPNVSAWLQADSPLEQPRQQHGQRI